MRSLQGTDRSFFVQISFFDYLIYLIILLWMQHHVGMIQMES